MRRVLAACLLCVSATAAQADGSSKWTGFYIGAHAGYGWGEWNGSLSYDDHDPGWPQPQYKFDSGNKSIEGEDWLGGLQVGFNYQTGTWVWGLEADVSWTGLNGSGSFLPYPNNADSPAWAIETQLNMFGTVRGRLGFTNGPLLIYATGGFAWGNVESSIQPIYDPGGSNGYATSDTTHIGYAAGGGLEWMLARNWTLKAEYLFIDLGEEDYAYVGKTKGGLPYDTDHFHPDLHLHTVRLGVNYKFGGN